MKKRETKRRREVPRDDTDEEMREVMPVFGKHISIAEVDKMTQALDETADEGGRLGDVSFMNFSGKKGIYQIGINKRDVEEEEPFLIAIPSFELGWMCWKGGKPAAKRMANVQQPRIPEPDPSELGPFDERRGEGWFKARAITARSMANDEQVYFTINSKSGVAVLSDLQRDVVARMKEGQPCWPVVTFDKEEFESQGYKNFKPKLEIIHWLTSEQVMQLADPDLDPLSLLPGGGDEDEGPEPEAPAPQPQRRRRL